MIADAPSVPTSDPAWDAIVADLRRREFLAGGLSLGTLLLAGCGDDETTGATTSTTASGTRRISTPRGPVDVPAQPKRVVCLDYFTAIFAVELGLMPAGAIDYSWVDDTSMYPPYVAPLKTLEPIGEITATDLEAVVSLQPDLILGPTPGSRYDNSPGAFAKLERVAPAVSIDFGQTGDWRGPYMATADALNRTAKAKQLRADFEGKASEIKAAHAEALATAVWTTLGYAEDGQFVIELGDSTSGIVLGSIGAKLGRAAAGHDTERKLSIERVDAIEDSTIVLYRIDAKGKPGNGLADVVGFANFKRLPAVRAGHLYGISWSDVCTYRWASAALDDIARILAKSQS